MKLVASIFRRSKNDLSLRSSDLVAESRNWYADRYETVLIQRNILLVLIVVALLCILVGVFAVEEISLSKSVDPFVVEVEDKSGITNIVNPNDTRRYSSDETMKRYFLLEYMRARETYDPQDYIFNYNTVVRLLSVPKVYRQFRTYLNENPRSPLKLAKGPDSKTMIKIRSIQFFEEGKAQVRFSISVGKEGAISKTYDRIATVSFAFTQMELTNDERYINPLGFQVSEYRVDDENL